MHENYAPQVMPPRELNTYHRNPRRGDVHAIASSLQVNGQYRPLVVNKGTHTGRPNEVLAGNHTLQAIRDLSENNPHDERWHTVIVHMIDVDADRAARIVLADNRTSDRATMDDDELAAMLEDLPDLSGTGYTPDDLAELRPDVPDFQPEEFGDTQLDHVSAKPCPKCGYDTANDPEDLA